MTDILTLPSESTVAPETSVLTSEAKLLSYATLKAQIIADLISDSLTSPATSKALSQIGALTLLSAKLDAGSNLADVGDPAVALLNLGIVDASTTAKGILELLTNGELAAGTDTTKAATAAAIASLFGTSLRSSNGYARLPVKVGGIFLEFIFQWGTVAAASIPSVGTNYTVTLPLTYPTANLFVSSPNPTNGSYAAGSTANTVVVSKSTSNFIFAHGQSPALDIMWFSAGY